MTIWNSLKSVHKPARGLFIEHGILHVYRPNGALTRLDIDSLKLAEIRVIRGDIYWYLTDQANAFALVPETHANFGDLRRYLAQWRGFNYDGLCRFNPLTDECLQLWPVEQRKSNAA